MKTDYEYIYFREIPNPGKKTTKWICKNEIEKRLGYIVWWGAWRKYVFRIDNTIIRNRDDYLVFDYNCFNDINEFADQLTKKQRRGWGKKK